MIISIEENPDKDCTESSNFLFKINKRIVSKFKYRESAELLRDLYVEEKKFQMNRTDNPTQEILNPLRVFRELK